MVTIIECVSCKSKEKIRYHKDHDKNLCKECHNKLHRERNQAKGNKTGGKARTVLCSTCMNYTTRLGGRCKLKEELLITTKDSCNKFDKISKEILFKNKCREKIANKNKSAKYCIGCVKNQEGFCLLYQRWAFNARGICMEMKGKVC